MDFDPSDLSKKMSPRHFSVGADGLVCICKSEVADAKMRMFNLDGSEGQMCGNAIRCVGKYLVDSKICTSKTLKIETLSGIKTLSDFTFDENGKVDKVTVDMGKASFSTKDIPISQDEEAIEQTMEIDGTKWKFSALSVGNPHCVVVTKSIDELDLEKIGPKFENNPLFPKRTNTEFVEVLSNDHLKMRVWERGSGETYACGTGACASVASCIKNGLCLANSEIKVDLIGGTLTIKCDDNFNILMTGPAKKIYEGVYFYDVEN